MGSAATADVTRVANTLLLLRVAEGLGAWVMFNMIHGSPGGGLLVGTAAFSAYFLANLLLALRYGGGHANTRLLQLDVAANVLLPAVPIVLSGGWLSPLILLIPLKAVGYALSFGTVAAIEFIAVGTGAAGLGSAIAAAGGIPETLLTASAPAPQAWAVATFGGLILALLTLTCLRRVSLRSVAVRSGEFGRERNDPEAAAVANALLTVSDAVSRLTRLEDILETVVEVAPRSLGVEYCGIALWEDETRSYTSVFVAGAGLTVDRRLAGQRVSQQEAPDFEWVRRLGHCAVVTHTESPAAANLNVPAVLIAPLTSGPRFYGVIQFARRGSDRPFKQRDITIADGIARQTAVALERARLIDESRVLAQALESTGEAVLITDPQRRVIFANPAFERTFGFSASSILGRDVLEFAGPADGWPVNIEAELERHGWRGEASARRADDLAVPVLLDVSPIRDANGRMRGIVATLKDISVEKHFQEQMQRADRLAALGHIAAGIAHEINNALAAIFGQTAKAGVLEESAMRESLRRVEAQARRIAAIVQGVLGFARPRPPHAESIDLVAVTEETLELVRHDCERQGVTVQTEWVADLPRAIADPQQVQQVLLNLFTNALQCLKERADGRLRVIVERAGEQLAVRVGDNGPGIPESVLPHIFDPFFSTKAEGTGLGLSVSYAIARSNRGDLLVETEVGKGTTFSLLLPVAQLPRERGLRHALLVDDDPEVAEALKEMLRDEGLEVRCAATGGEALAMAGAEPWDAIFLDVRLPDLSGPEVYAEIERTRPQLASRVVFVTGGLWRSEARMREKLPAAPTLGKPCTQEQVRAVLRVIRDQAAM